MNGLVIGDADKELVPVLHDKVAFDVPVWLVAPSELRTSRRVRIVFDMLTEELGRKKT